MPPQTWPAVATSQASILASDWIVFALAGLAIAALVWGLILFAIARWRRREGAHAPPQFRNNYPLEIAWTVAPLLIVLALFAYTYNAEAKVESLAPHPDLTVHVTAFRWGWKFAYVGGPTVGGAQEAPSLGSPAGAVPVMVLPLGKLVRIDVASLDVDHSFWVPDFLFKRDAIPGQVTAFDLQPDKLGTFPGHCAEFCGFNHALMNFSVRVVPEAEFERWRSEAMRS